MEVENMNRTRADRRWKSLAAGIVGYLFLSCSNGVAARDAVPSQGSIVRSAVEQELRRLASASDGVFGVAASWVGGAPLLAVNGDVRFPMASTFKVAVAATILAKVDSGRLQLSQMVEVPPDLYVESDIIASRLIHPGVVLSVHNLLELMLTESDNTATDVLVKLAGGPAAVTAWLQQHGIKDQRVDRDTSGLIRDFYSLGPGSIQSALAAAEKVNPHLDDLESKPNTIFDDDPRDTSTPLAMLSLLNLLFDGGALSRERTQDLVDIMIRCRTGEGRIKGLLPAGTQVAHKTGTIGGTLNDVGVITLPDGRRLVVAVFIKKSAQPFVERERLIAEVARTIRDAFLVTER
jgi:beta-lactamase class A